ncbi:aspartate/glutamate racemase family protein [Micromonospora sp. NPDC047548]|uniref:aspartate/glutamate racemase family protein n=1 Tax=Micromonospora sp. NPDC047548 TaxID=3155624 RepID=UPI0033CCC8CB
MPTIGFLHTADVHVPTFRALTGELAPSWRDVHVVDPGLLADARAHGVDTELLARLRSQLRRLAAAGADVVVCTCSTLSGHAERTGPEVPVPVLRVDRPMAEAAVAGGGRIAVVAAVPSTLEPTLALLRESAEAVGVDVSLREVPCPEAWPLFEAGEHDAYLRRIAARARDVADEVDVIVLAQASMAPAVHLLRELGVPVLCSPRSAVARATGPRG